MAYVGKNPKFDSMILDDQVSDSVDAPASGSYKLINRNGALFNVDSSGVESAVGSGSSGEINYIDESDAEIAIANWATYADAAGTTPVDGTGGSANITFTRQSSTVLRGTQTYQFTKDAADRQGEGVAIPFTIKGQDTNKKLKIQFDFKSDEDATYADGDLSVYVYDITNSTLITPTDVNIPVGQNIYQTSFNSTSSTSYRLIFHVASTNASAWDVYLDDVIVGPGMTSQGAAIGPWQSFTPTGSWSTNTTYTGFYRRVGDSMDVEYKVATSGAPTAAALTVDLPSGFTINTGAITETSAAGLVLGQAQIRENGVAFYIGIARYSDTNTLRIDYINDDTAAVKVEAAVSNTAPFTFGADDFITIRCTGIPISEWADKGIVPMLAEDNLSSPQNISIDNGNFTNDAGLTISGSFTAMRVGGALSCSFFFSFAGTGTDASALTFSLPSEFGSINIESGTYGGVLARFDNNTVGDRYPSVLSIVSTGSNTLTFSGFLGNQFGSAGTNIDSVVGTLLLPITEYAGSQNSLVGYSEATSSNLGLVKKNKYQIKTLTSDVNADGELTDLDFVLESGKTYRVSIQARMTGNNTDGSCAIEVRDSTTIIARLLSSPDDTVGVGIYSTSVIHTMSSTDLNFNLDSASANAGVNGDSTQSETFVLVEELNNIEVTTEW